MRAGALLLVLSTAFLPCSLADSAAYRSLPGLPAAPEAGLPLPCTVNPDLSFSCGAPAAWAGAFTTWASALPGQAGPLAGDAADWAGAAAGDASSLYSDEFTFVGPAGTTQATIHVHDTAAAAAGLDAAVVFVVRGGPGGDRWVCKHVCTVPDTGFRVTVDPLEVPSGAWAGFDPELPLPNLPAVSGTIAVTFS